MAILYGRLLTVKCLRKAFEATATAHSGWAAEMSMQLFESELGLQRSCGQDSWLADSDNLHSQTKIICSLLSRHWNPFPYFHKYYAEMTGNFYVASQLQTFAHGTMLRSHSCTRSVISAAMFQAYACCNIFTLVWDALLNRAVQECDVT